MVTFADVKKMHTAKDRVVVDRVVVDGKGVPPMSLNEAFGLDNLDLWELMTTTSGEGGGDGGGARDFNPMVQEAVVECLVEVGRQFIFLHLFPFVYLYFFRVFSLL